MERDLTDGTVSHGETNPDAKDEQHSAKVYDAWEPHAILFCVWPYPIPNHYH